MSDITITAEYSQDIQEHFNSDGFNSDHDALSRVFPIQR